MKNHQHLVQPQRQQGQGNNVLYQAFNSYPNSSVISQEDLSDLANKYGNFYSNYRYDEYNKLSGKMIFGIAYRSSSIRFSYFL